MRSRLIVNAAAAVGSTLIVAALVSLRAQSSSNGPAFEVVSVKAGNASERNRGVDMPPGRLMVTNLPLRSVIRLAYGIQDFQLSGAPSWINTDAYDIEARAGADGLNADGRVPPDRLAVMVRALLADRFKFVAHLEKRELSAYALVLARSDGRLGPQLQRADVDCEALDKSGRPPPANGPGKPPVCGGAFGAGNLIFNGFPLSRLAVNLSTWVQRVVIDRTGLEGPFNVHVQWTVDQRPPFDSIGAPAREIEVPADQTGPSIFTALQEQLGLRLEAVKAPVDVLVIDRVERPTPD